MTIIGQTTKSNGTIKKYKVWRCRSQSEDVEVYNVYKKSVSFPTGLLQFSTNSQKIWQLEGIQKETFNKTYKNDKNPVPIKTILLLLRYI